MPPKLTFNIDKGFSWNAVLFIDEQKHKKNKIIYKGEAPSFAITIYLDKENNLHFTLKDNAGKKLSTKAVSGKELLNRNIYLCCEISPAIKKTNRIQIFVNNRLVSENKIQAEFNEVVPIDSTIGSTGTSFTLSELAIYKKALTIDQRCKLSDYFRKKWHLVKREERIKESV